MRRRAFNLAASLSLVLFAAIVALWVRSYRTADQIQIKSASYPCIGNDPEFGPMFKDHITNAAIVSNHGALEVDVVRSTRDDGSYLGQDNIKDWTQEDPEGTFVLYDRFPAEPSGGHFPSFNLHDASVQIDHLGLFVGRYSIEGMMRGSVDFTGHVVSVPLWLLVMMAAVLPALRLLRWRAAVRRSRQVSRLRCPSCSYDLRATPDRCPECGAGVAARE